MVGVAVTPDGAVGGADAGPAWSGVFQVSENATFGPRATEGPNNWKTGA